MDSVTTDINPMRSYRVIPSDNTDDAVSAPPCSVYSNTAADTTHYSTVSGITENNSPAKSTMTVHKEKEWKALEEHTAALEKAAEVLAATEKANQIEFERKNAERTQ
eukprot:11142317-Ditylum_brightwellii.AAC.1